jgi:hypothetical protein
MQIETSPLYDYKSNEPSVATFELDSMNPSSVALKSIQQCLLAHQELFNCKDKAKIVTLTREATVMAQESFTLLANARNEFLTENVENVKRNIDTETEEERQARDAVIKTGSMEDALEKRCREQNEELQDALKNDPDGEIATRHKEFCNLMSFGPQRQRGPLPSWTSKIPTMSESIAIFEEIKMEKLNKKKSGEVSPTNANTAPPLLSTNETDTTPTKLQTMSPTNANTDMSKETSKETPSVFSMLSAEHKDEYGKILAHPYTAPPLNSTNETATTTTKLQTVSPTNVNTAPPLLSTNETNTTPTKLFAKVVRTSTSPLSFSHLTSKHYDDIMPSPLVRLQLFRENLKTMIQSNSPPTSPFNTNTNTVITREDTDTLDDSMFGERHQESNSASFTRLQDLNYRVSSIKNELSRIVSGQAYAPLSL